MVHNDVGGKQAAVADSDRLQGLCDMNVLPMCSVCENMIFSLTNNGLSMKLRMKCVETLL